MNLGGSSLDLLYSNINDQHAREFVCRTERVPETPTVMWES